MQWFANILSRAGILGKTMDLPCIVRASKDRVCLELLEVALPCGHSGYRLDLAFYVEEFDRWVPIASLRDYNLEQSIELLTQAKACIDRLRE